MGCSASIPASNRVEPAPSSSLGFASSIQPQIQAPPAASEPLQQSRAEPLQHGAIVCLGSRQFKVQYVSSKGTLDLKADDGEVLYGVDPSSVTVVKDICAGEFVQLDGTKYKVQYVSSKGTLDLKSDGGEVLYGIDPASVILLEASPSSALPAAPPHEAPAPAPAPDALSLDSYPVSPAQIELLGSPLTKVMGSGARLYRCHLDGGTEVLACKLLPVAAPEHKRSDVLTEIALCRKLHHTHIVRFDLLAECVEVDHAKYLAIVMEFVPVTLEDLLAARRPPASPARRPFSAVRLGSIFANLASAVHYLHSGESASGVPTVHGDLKPLNICFPPGALEEDAVDNNGAASPAASDAAPPSSGSEKTLPTPLDSKLRLIDFGAAAESEVPLHEFTGTLVTVPPEMYAGEPYHTPADVWAMGMLLQWCLLLENPMGERTMAEWDAVVSATPAALPVFEFEAVDGEEPTGGEGAAAKGARPWGEDLESFAALARRCLARKPEERATAKEVAARCEEIARRGC